LARVEALLLQTAGGSAHPLVAEASTHLARAGGKRLRPALVLIASHAGEPGRRATDLAGAAIELVHLASLYHDDVIDQTVTRRGVPTVHSKWGVEVAVLSGDYLFACGCGLGAEAGGEVPAILARAIAEVCEGQIVETASVGDTARTVEQYMATIGGKTAALFRAACELGATTSDADAQARAALVDYGEALGLAFQMVDDLLDITGDADVLGKEPGTDLKEGVFTLPILLALEREPELKAWLSDGRRLLSDVLPVLERSRALEDALAAAGGQAQRARAALGRLPEGPWRSALEKVVDSVMAQLS
jgi:heptaprenyl diphosphate synthase